MIFTKIVVCFVMGWVLWNEPHSILSVLITVLGIGILEWLSCFAYSEVHLLEKFENVVILKWDPFREENRFTIIHQGHRIDTDEPRTWLESYLKSEN